MPSLVQVSRAAQRLEMGVECSASKAPRSCVGLVAPEYSPDITGTGVIRSDAETGGPSHQRWKPSRSRRRREPQ